MSTRHVARSLALQTLFELDMREVFDMPASDLLDVISRNQLEFAPEVKDIAFVRTLVEETVGRRITLDDIIVRAAPDWPLAKIGTVDRNILRLGLFELLFGDRSQVPPKVAIDEAIELAKTFGGETSGRFVNGVLGAIYKELGEPGKNEQSKPRIAAVKEELWGAVVISTGFTPPKIALILDKFGYWTFPKGHHIEGESREVSLPNIILDEIGVESEVVGVIGQHEYLANNPEKGKVAKHVVYSVCTTVATDLPISGKDGILESRLFDESEIGSLKVYDDVRHFVPQALALIQDED